MKERIQAFYHATPFRPMVIHTADGRNFGVSHPEFLAFSRDPNAPFVVIVGEDDQLHVVAVAQIVDVEAAVRL